MEFHPLQPIALYRKCLITIVNKTVFIDIEFIDAPLDYNILLA